MAPGAPAWGPLLSFPGGLGVAIPLLWAPASVPTAKLFLVLQTQDTSPLLLCSGWH